MICPYRQLQYTIQYVYSFPYNAMSHLKHWVCGTRVISKHLHHYLLAWRGLKT